MPVGEQAAGRSLGTIFYPARPTARLACGQLWHLFPRFLFGRGFFRDQVCCLARGARSRFGAQLVLPREIFLLRFEAREITAANRAAAGTGAKSQQQSRPTWSVIAIRRPFRE